MGDGLCKLCPYGRTTYPIWTIADLWDRSGLALEVDMSLPGVREGAFLKEYAFK